MIWTLQGEEDGRTQEVCGDNACGTLEENVVFLRTKIRGELLKSSVNYLCFCEES